MIYVINYVNKIRKNFFKNVKQNTPQNRLTNISRYLTGNLKKGALFMMEQNYKTEPMWRIWVDTKRRIVSFHEEEGCQLLEFRSREMFLSCVDQYSGKQYRYQ